MEGDGKGGREERRGGNDEEREREREGKRKEGIEHRDARNGEEKTGNEKRVKEVKEWRKRVKEDTE